MEDVFEDRGTTRLVAGSIWFLVFMTLGGALGVVWTILLSRFYGPAGYGIFNTAFSFHTFAWIAVFGGLYQGLIKYGSEYAARGKGKLQTYFASAIKYTSLLGIGVCILLLLVARYLPETVGDSTTRIIIIAVAFSLLFSGAKDGIAAIIGSVQKNDYLSIINSSKLTIIFFAGLAFIVTGMRMNFSPLVIALASAGQLVVSIHFLKIYIKSSFWFRLGKILRHKTSFKLFKEAYVFGLFISVGIIAFNVMKSLDIIVLKLFLDYTDVGIYSVADLYSSILFYMTSFALPLIPAISEANARGEKRLLAEYVKTALKYSLMIGLPLTIILMMLSEPLIVNIYGKAFSPAVTPLRILIVGTFMLMLSYNLSSILVGLGHAKLSGELMFAAATQYILLLFLLIPSYKFVGAALALTLTGFSSVLLVPYYVKKVTEINLYEGLWKVGIAIIATMLFLASVPKTNLIVTIVDAFLGTSIFFALLYLTGYMTKDDIEMLRVAFESFRVRLKSSNNREE